MSLFRVYVDGALFYHPQMSKLAITDARIHDAFRAFQPSVPVRNPPAGVHHRLQER